MPTERQLRWQENHQRRKIADYFVPGTRNAIDIARSMIPALMNLLDDWMTAGPADDLTPSN